MHTCLWLAQHLLTPLSSLGSHFVIDADGKLAHSAIKVKPAEVRTCAAAMRNSPLTLAARLPSLRAPQPRSRLPRDSRGRLSSVV